MKINIIENINFKENTQSGVMNSQDAILMLRDPNAAVKFQKNKEYTQKADSVDSNPIVAVGYKLYRTFNMLINDSDEPSDESAKLDTLA